MKRVLILVAALVLNLILAATALGAVVEVNTVKGTTSTDTTGVYISWNTYTGAASYKILRSTDGVDWSTNFSSGARREYDDTTITNYINYFYKVQALNGGNSVIATSNVLRAFPPNTSPHGNFLVNKSACASCHATHTGQSPKLTATPTTTGICSSCHDGTGSKYDSQNGKVKMSATPDWADSAAGPFGSLGQAGNTATPTSTHGLSGIAVNTAPGSSTSAVYNLGCGSCHDPHNQLNYRLLRRNLATSLTAPVVDVQGYAVTAVSGETISYVSGSVNFCGSCHSDFNQGTGSGSTGATTTQQVGYTLSGASAGTHMHSVDIPISNYVGADTNILPLEGASRKVVCLTCHMAHGTTKTGAVATNNPKYSGSGGLSTVLKRVSGATVCEECHRK